MNESITGQLTVNDTERQSGIVVKAVHEPTGSIFAKKTDSNGTFLFDRLKAGGPYVISVQASGYEPIELTGVHLKTGECLTRDMNLVQS